MGVPADLTSPAGRGVAGAPGAPILPFFLHLLCFCGKSMPPTPDKESNTPRRQNRPGLGFFPEPPEGAPTCAHLSREAQAELGPGAVRPWVWVILSPGVTVICHSSGGKLSQPLREGQ